MMELTGVSKTYNEVSVLSPLDLEIAAGRTTVLIGPSGCGKSTLLRLMIGLIRPDTGTVRFERRRTHSGECPAATAANGLRHPGWRAVSPPDRPR